MSETETTESAHGVKLILQEGIIRYERAVAEWRGELKRLELYEAVNPHWAEKHQEAYTIAKAMARKELDQLVARWRDFIHVSMKQIPLDPAVLHAVMDSMDQYLNRSKD